MGCPKLNIATFSQPNFKVTRKNTDTQKTRVVSFFDNQNSGVSYYPFGMVMPGRSGGVGNYRYGYQGSEKDNEVKGNGNSYTTHFRQLDPRLGRWLSIDPKASSMPWQSPYCSMDNSPIMFNDILGDSTDYGLTDAGRVYQIGETNDEPDRLFKIGSDKKKIDIPGKDYVTIQDKSLLKGFLEPTSKGTITLPSGKIASVTPPRGETVVSSKNQRDIAKLFYFAAKNTNVEFAIASLKGGNNTIGTRHEHDGSPTVGSLLKGNDISNLISWVHSHPYDASHKQPSKRLESMSGDNGIVQDFIEEGTFNFRATVFFPKYNEGLELTKGFTKEHSVESYWGVLKLLKPTK